MTRKRHNKKPIPQKPYSVLGKLYYVIACVCIAFKVNVTLAILLLVGGFVFITFKKNTSFKSLNDKILNTLYDIFYKFFVAMMSVVGILVVVVVSNKVVYEPIEDSYDDQETTTWTVNNQDTSLVHNRVWYDYDNNRHVGKVEIKKTDYLTSKYIHISSKRPYIDEHYWQNVYLYLQHLDSNKLDAVYQMFEDIRDSEVLNVKEFAELITTFVQDIPYHLILEASCTVEANHNNEWVINYLNKCSDQCCQGKILFGLHSPVEFMATLKGDCDTRTLFTHQILSYFGYDVVILNSDKYGHSMLGIALPYSGDHKAVNGKRYYFLELTAKNWKPGVLPPENSNVNYWDVALSSSPNNNYTIY